MSRDATIMEGDLVEVVRPTGCCGNRERIGYRFQIGKIERGNLELICVGCGASKLTNVLAIEIGRRALTPEDASAFELWRLRKLPQIPESETTDSTTDTREEVEA